MKKHVALFAGLGGFLVAAKRNGIDTVFATDLEEGCTKTVETSFPGISCVSEDITKLHFEDHFDLEPNVDLLVLGFRASHSLLLVIIWALMIQEENFFLRFLG